MKYTLSPRITEKTYRGISEDKKAANTYTFKVEGSASKEVIKKMVEDQFKVTVVDVRTVTLPGKVRRFRGVLGHTSEIKKALVRLAPGQTINAFDISTDEGDKKDKE
jgi:large subunit ribosomal protein L23